MNNPVQSTSFESKDDNIYYNIALTNNQNVSVPATFSQTLTSNVIDNPVDYYLSVIRFELDGSSIPIFIFKDNTYYITLSYGGNNYTYPILFIPYSQTIEEGQAIFSYQAFINMINQTFITCFNALKTANPTAPQTQAPYMLYNPNQNGLISLYAQTSYDSSLTDAIQIFFNATLYYFFDNFLTMFYSEGSASKKDYQILVQNNYGSNTSALDSSIPANYYKMSQDYPSLYHWWDTTVLSFKSTQMGVRSEYTPTQNQSNNLVSNNSAGSGVSNTSQITDFIPSISTNDPAGWRSTIVYYPSSQYRLLDLLSNQIKCIDVNISWRDKQNKEYQYYIPPNQTVSIKMIFVKKSLFKNYTK